MGHRQQDVPQAAGGHTEPPSTPEDVIVGTPTEARSKQARPSIANQLMNIALDSMVALFRTPDGVPYVTLRAGSVVQAHEIKSTQLRNLLRHLYYERYRSVLGADNLRAVIDQLSAEASVCGTVRQTYTRVARHNDTIYLDLCNDEWEVVEVDASGWRVVSRPPVVFKRSDTMRQLPRPISGGTLEQVQRFANVRADDWILYVGFLLGTLRGRGPYPLLGIYGEQGSGKSSSARVVKELIDPAVPLLRPIPKVDENVITGARNNHLLVYTNLSGIPDWLSDVLSRLSTDGGYSTRTLYETLEETIFEGLRPVVINGIPELITRGDLMDRAIQIELAPISDEKRQDEDSFWCDFHDAQAKILGALLSAASFGLRECPSVELDRKPRMLDFTRFVVAAERGCPWPSGRFLEVYVCNRRQANREIVNNDELAQAITELMDSRAEAFAGTATQLLAELTENESRRARPRMLPRNARSLGKRLKRLAPSIRAVGYPIHQPRTGEERTICLGKKGDKCSDVLEPEDLQTSLFSESGNVISDVSDVSSAGHRGRRETGEGKEVVYQQREDRSDSDQTSLLSEDSSDTATSTRELDEKNYEEF